MIHDDNDVKQSEEQETETNDDDVNLIEDTDMPPVVGGILLRDGSGDLNEQLVTEISESDSSDSGDTGEDQDTKTNVSNSAHIFEIFGLISILYGIAVGIVLFIGATQGSAEVFGQSVNPIVAFLVALGGALIFIVPGVICYGISKILNTLNK